MTFDPPFLPDGQNQKFCDCIDCAVKESHEKTARASLFPLCEKYLLLQDILEKA